jgi:hypothetical protein
VVRGHHVVEHAQAVTFLCLEKPLEITAAVPGKLEQEFLFVAAMRNMPNTSRNVMPICPRHLIGPSLEGLFPWQKHHPKPQNRLLSLSLSQDSMGFSWSDPRGPIKWFHYSNPSQLSIAQRLCTRLALYRQRKSQSLYTRMLDSRAQLTGID